MYNWSTDEDYLKKFPEEYEKWQLLQLINYGLDGEKIDLKLLKKRWDNIKDEVLEKNTVEYIERFILERKRPKIIKIDNPFNFAVDKLHSILTEKKAQSFVDFYTVLKSNKNLALKKLLRGLKTKHGYTIDPLFLAESFLKIENLHDYPKMIKPFSPEEMISYFLGLAKSLKHQIIT